MKRSRSHGAYLQREAEAIPITLGLGLPSHVLKLVKGPVLLKAPHTLAYWIHFMEIVPPAL